MGKAELESGIASIQRLAQHGFTDAHSALLAHMVGVALPIEASVGPQLQMVVARRIQQVQVQPGEGDGDMHSTQSHAFFKKLLLLPPPMRWYQDPKASDVCHSGAPGAAITVEGLAQPISLAQVSARGFSDLKEAELQAMEADLAWRTVNEGFNPFTVSEVHGAPPACYAKRPCTRAWAFNAIARGQ